MAHVTQLEVKYLKSSYSATYSNEVIILKSINISHCNAPYTQEPPLPLGLSCVTFNG